MQCEGGLYPTILPLQTKPFSWLRNYSSTSNLREFFKNRNSFHILETTLIKDNLKIFNSLKL